MGVPNTINRQKWSKNGSGVVVAAMIFEVEAHGNAMLGRGSG